MKRDPDQLGRIEACRICKKPLHHTQILQHAHHYHPVAFHNYLQSRADFGMAELDHFQVAKAVIRT